MLLQNSLHRHSASPYLQSKGCREERHAVAELHAAKALPSGGWGVQGHSIFVGVLVWSQTKHAHGPTCIANQQFGKLTAHIRRPSSWWTFLQTCYRMLVSSSNLSDVITSK